jgi:hypothetical protein
MIQGVTDIYGDWFAGEYSIELKDASGNPVDPAQIESLFDPSGNMNLPTGYSGVITGPGGNTITFDGVETIGRYS